MRKTIYACDINTCKFATEDINEIKKSRILDKEYDLCPNCRKSFEDFVDKRLAAGTHNPSGKAIQEIVDVFKGISSTSPSGGFNPSTGGQIYKLGDSNPVEWTFTQPTTDITGITLTHPTPIIHTDTSGIEKIDPSKPIGISVAGSVMYKDTPNENSVTLTETSISEAFDSMTKHQPDPLS